MLVKNRGQKKEYIDETKLDIGMTEFHLMGTNNAEIKVSVMMEMYRENII